MASVCAWMTTVDNDAPTDGGRSSDDGEEQGRLALCCVGTEVGVPRGGKLMIGRSTVCDVFLNDPTVSRRHARVSTRGRRLVLEDLGSSNGTHLNGKPIAAARELALGDVLSIGKYELTVIRATRPEKPSSPGAYRVAGDDLGDPERITLPAQQPSSKPRAPHADEATKRRDAHSLIFAAAEGALAEGSSLEAERLAGGLLRELLAATRSSAAPPAELVARASVVAARLGAAREAGEWIDLAVALCTASHCALPPAALDAIDQALDQIAALDHASLRAYGSTLQARFGTLSPTELLSVRRLEEIERRALRLGILQR